MERRVIGVVGRRAMARCLRGVAGGDGVNCRLVFGGGGLRLGKRGILSLLLPPFFHFLFVSNSKYIS